MAALAVAPAIVTLCLILHYGVDMPGLDEWQPDINSLFIKAHSGELSIGDFFAQHNEHRIAIPRIVIFLCGLLTGWNIEWELIIEWLVVCATSAGILWLCVQTSDRDREPGEAQWAGFSPRVLFKWFLCNLLLFGPVHFENWLSGIGLCNVMPMGFIVAGMIVAVSNLRAWTRLSIAGALAAAAMYSSGNGVLAWPLIGILLAWSSSKRELVAKKLLLSIWCLTFVILVCVYLIGFQGSSQLNSREVQRITPLSFVEYCLTFVGNQFSFGTSFPPMGLGLVLGAIMVMLLVGAMSYFLWLWLSQQEFELSRRILVWLVIGCFAVASGMLAAWFRGSLGVEKSFTSRYVAFSQYLPIALINLVPLICGDLYRRLQEVHRTRGESQISDVNSTGHRQGITAIWTEIPAFLTAALMIAYLLGVPVGLNGFRDSARKYRVAKGDLLLIRVFTDNPRLRQYFEKDPAQVVQQAQALSDLGYFHPAIIDSANAAKIRVESNSQAPCGAILQYSQRDNNLIIMGRAVQPGTSKPADAVFISFDNEAREPIILALGFLGAKFGNQAETDPEIPSQWGATIPFSQLPGQFRVLTLRAWEFDIDTGKATELGGAFTISR